MSVLLPQELFNNAFAQVHQTSLPNGLASLTIEHARCQAKVSLYGGQVLSWKPNGHRDIFWLSDTAIFEQGKAIRGGIPLCWPWFGAHPDSNTAGNHGFARGQTWQVCDISSNESSVDITLSLQGNNMHSLFPYAFKLTQVLSFGASFKQSLTMVNLSEQDAHYTGALHSYFSVSNPENITVSKLDEAPFDDKLTGEHCAPQPLLNGVGPVDRVYYSDQKMQIVDTQWQRTIEVSADNTQQWVFWNPGIAIANGMADIHEAGEQEFVCLEAANTQQQLLARGKAVTVSQVIKVIANTE
ncbi:MAG: D-hexose-6-phosphate mutarotase [Colwellia sp.]|nr:D-hexose-6-phosphate mutarotase [Colwellia sp.]MCW8864922.1 D-hexose-6-phosphate mutarotase [Colwellia sp.]MCW9080540.1 D-hexose-6-phosphate mutarotase [Colwellia sp.]